MSSLSICSFIGDICFYKVIRGLVKHEQTPASFAIWPQMSAMELDRYSKTVLQGVFHA